MKFKLIGIVLGALWLAAIVWMLGSERRPPEDEVAESERATQASVEEAPPHSTDAATEAATEAEQTPAQPSAEELAAAEEAAAEQAALDARAEAALERFRERAANPDPYQREVLREIFKPLEKAAERYSEHDALDDSRWFGEDQESNQKAIDRLLDQSIDVLEVSEIAETRGRLRGARDRIEQLRRDIARDREARLAAPREEELGRVEKQFKDSREDIDQRIEESELEIADLERNVVDLEQTFVEELREIGIEVDRETARSLLSTVSGDDFVEMCVAFDNVRLVTVQLQTLTEQAGESLDVARRYYGSYVVLIRIMDRVQKEFVRRIEEEQLPKLAQFKESARENIAQARRNLAQGGDPNVAQQNINSNELTLEACEFYSRFLVEQARAVEGQNEALQAKLRDAENTYDTVRLSSQVAELLREGQRNFSALLELEVPELRGFENAELEAEFERLTQELLQP